MFKIFSVSNPSLDYETFAKRNSLKFTLGRLRTAITNTRQETILMELQLIEHVKSETESCTNQSWP